MKGYYASQALSNDPTVTLPDISLKQIVASEKPMGSETSRVCVFTDSTTGALYFTKRTLDYGTFTDLKTIWVPIRRVQDFYLRSITLDLTVEVIYVRTRDIHVRHLMCMTWRLLRRLSSQLPSNGLMISDYVGVFISIISNSSGQGLVIQ